MTRITMHEIRRIDVADIRVQGKSRWITIYPITERAEDEITLFFTSREAVNAFRATLEQWLSRNPELTTPEGGTV